MGCAIVVLSWRLEAVRNRNSLANRIMERWDSRSCQILKKDIENEGSIRMRHRLVNQYLGHRIANVESVIGQGFPDDVSYEEMIECLWEDLKIAQEQIKSVYHLVM